MAGGIEFSASGYLAVTVGTAFAEVGGVALGGALEAGMAEPFPLEMGPEDFPNPRIAAQDLKALVAGHASKPARRGALKRVSDEALAAVLKTVAGGRAAASRTLAASGITLSDSAIFVRIDEAPQDSPLAPFKEGPKSGPPKRISDDDLLRILKEVDGVQIHAVALLAERGIILKRAGFNKRVGQLREAGKI